MKKIINYKNLSIGNKFTVTFCLWLLVPLLLMFLWINKSVTDQIVEENCKTRLEILKQTEYGITNMIENVTSVTLDIIGDGEIQNYLKISDTEDEEADNLKNDIAYNLGKITSLKTYLSRISIFTEEKIVFQTGKYMVEEKAIEISDVAQQEGRIVWDAAKKDENYLLSRDRDNYEVSAYRAIVSYYDFENAAKPVVEGLNIRTEISRELPNILPLDVCRYCHAGEWSEKMPVWQAQRELREKLEMQANWYNGAPQRYTWVDVPHKNDGACVQMEFEFMIAETGVKNLKVAIEDLEQFTILCNGTEIYCKGDALTGEFFLDPDFKTLEIPAGVLSFGKNTLTMQTNYEQRMELEDIYVLGDFAVNTDRELVKEEGSLKIGDWCSQGYPYYGGGITYHFKTGKIETDGRVGLFLQEWKAAVIKVSVNGKLAGHIGWKGQDGLDITDYLQDVNEIDVKVITTPRNIFGPFHQKYDSCVRSSFKDFRTEGKDYTEEYLLEPQGLLKPVTLQKI